MSKYGYGVLMAFVSMGVQATLAVKEYTQEVVAMYEQLQTGSLQLSLTNAHGQRFARLFQQWPGMQAQVATIQERDEIEQIMQRLLIALVGGTNPRDGIEDPYL